MRLRQVRVRNFRCYTEEVAIDVEDFTSLIGRNDAGKSTILEALSIFFEEDKPDSDDASKHGVATDMAITCEFDDLPDALVLDATNRTRLSEEHLLNSRGRLEISRVFNGSLKTPTAKNFIRALHPSVEGASDLLALKVNELKARARELGVDLTGVNQSVNAELRRAIRAHFDDLELEERLIEVDAQIGAKELYSKIREVLPAFFLFRSDRASTDQDSEAQDPMKVAVRLAIEQQHEALATIASLVHEQVTELVAQTLEKVAAMSPEIAEELVPRISEPKWDSVFKIALNSAAEIPLNKRGSGVRRLVLLGFLQAQAESKRIQSPDNGVIYAIEEPETSQHPDKQRALLQVLQEISSQAGYQVLITTHTPMLGRLLPESTLRFISVGSDSARVVHGPGENTMSMVAAALGVLPDHDVKVFVGVEGKHDETYLKAVSRTLALSDAEIDDLQDLEDRGKLIFIPVSGSNVGLWVSRLHKLGRPEFHIFDRDYAPPAQPHYGEAADLINARENCKAVHTSKRELENYLHPEAITAARPEVVLDAIAEFDDVPLLAAQAVHAASESDKEWDELESKTASRKVSNAKKWLNAEAAVLMTAEQIETADHAGEVKGWLKEITALARG